MLWGTPPLSQCHEQCHETLLQTIYWCCQQPHETRRADTFYITPIHLLLWRGGLACNRHIKCQGNQCNPVCTSETCKNSGNNKQCKASLLIMIIMCDLKNLTKMEHMACSNVVPQVRHPPQTSPTCGNKCINQGYPYSAPIILPFGLLTKTFDLFSWPLDSLMKCGTFY